ncbi:MAG: hemerythrin domain-containing protein, partial [Candidatus Aminicenantes bacterium]|nr:hemerythrin domain-containing protein [Candidatus Aminicenantes bacterium]
MESFQSQNKRTERLTDLCLRVIGNQAGKKDIDDLAADINNVEPNEVISIVEVVIKKGKDMDDNKRRLSKVLNIIHKGISNYKWKLPDENLFLKDMMKENSHLKERLNKLKKYMKGINESEGFFSMARSDMNSFLDNVLILKEIEYHYLKKENILFPYLEKHGGHLKCLPVMWSIHDDVRSSLKHIGQLREEGVKDVKTL